MEINLLEHPLIAQDIALRQFQHKFRNLIISRESFFQLCGKLLSAFLATFLQDKTTALRLHAGTETMRNLTIVFIRLICALQIFSSSLFSVILSFDSPPLSGRGPKNRCIDYRLQAARCQHMELLFFLQKLLIPSFLSDKISSVYLFNLFEVIHIC